MSAAPLPRSTPSALLLAALLAALGSAGCSGTQPTRVGPAYEAPVEGEQVWTVRYNPPPCLSDRPELHVEVQTPTGWERVVLEDGIDAADGVALLLERLSALAVDTGAVRANLIDRVQLWGNRHASRTLIVLDPNPPAVAPSNGEGDGDGEADSDDAAARRRAPDQGAGGGGISPSPPRARSKQRSSICRSSGR